MSRMKASFWRWYWQRRWDRLALAEKLRVLGIVNGRWR